MSGGEKVGILVVEDESIVALDIRETLVACGYEVVACVATGEEAVAVAGEARPSLVLMDIRLQGGMDGLEAARRIREAWQIPSVFLSAHADGELLKRAKAADALGYLLKPFNERELAVALEMALHRAGRERALVRPAGECEDMLQLRTLGGLEVCRGGTVLARAEDLTPAQRELLAILVAAPQRRVSREEVLADLWPDSAPEKARSSFDSLLLRLRKALDGAPCLVLRKGILSLEGCRIDAVEFVGAVRRGLRHLALGDHPRAEEALTAALEEWQGPFLLGAYGSESAFTFHEDLKRRYVEAVLALGEILAARDRRDEAVALLERALAGERSNDDLVRSLCRLLARGGQQGRLRQVLHRYREALRAEGFPESEIDEILAALPLPGGGASL